jgi:2-polyprenyl-3-methyl-5-hydroxy-6-metoxy-1,4-benzoquinol methylase
MDDDVLAGYSASSGELILRFEAISPDRLYEYVIDLLPIRSSRIADIGSGTGRDAAWLARKGHAVTAVEPVDELRQAAMGLHQHSQIQWVNDRLPNLSLLQRGESFDLVILSAVWQHLSDGDRRVAMQTLAGITKPDGMVIMSIRHGPGAKNRRVFPANAQDTIDMAVCSGFALMRACRAESVQSGNRAAGVNWTWLALRRT